MHKRIEIITNDYSNAEKRDLPNLVQYIKKTRATLGWTLESFAEHTGATVAKIKRLECRRDWLTPKEVLNISSALGITRADLLKISGYL